MLFRRAFYELLKKLSPETQIHLLSGFSLQPFFEGAEHGVILFSLGSDLRSDEIPNEKLQEFVEAFRGLKQRVLWKYESDVPPNLPENVKAVRWFPQSSALGHPKVVLFITHGGILSVEESLQRGVPMLFIPFQGDQQRAARHAVQNGYGKTLQFDELTRETLTNAINTMTSTPQFKQSAITFSKFFTDNPISPMKEAVFWIEHTIRTKGAYYMKSHSAHLNRCQHLLFDVASFYFAILAISVMLCVLVIKFVIKRYRNKEQKGKFKYY